MTAENNSASHSWRMSPDEIAIYAKARESMEQAGRKRARVAAKDKPMSKAESVKIGKAMIQAVVKCDQDLAMSLLESGAAVNARDAAGKSALDLALELCGKGGDMHAFCDELVGRGGWVAPERYSGMAAEFSDTVGKGKPVEGLLRGECVKLTRHSLLKNSAQWSLIKNAMAHIDPAESVEKTLTDLGQAWRFGILRQAAASGEALPKSCMAAAVSRLTWEHRWSAKPTIFNSPEGKEFVGLLREPAGVQALEGKAVVALFGAAAWESDVGVLMAMLDAGLRPGADWMGKLEVVEGTGWQAKIAPVAVSLLAVAAASPSGRGAFDALKAFEPALSAARANAPNPQALAMIPAQKLFDLHEAGVDIGATDSVGTVAHWWARLDDKPRDGWAMLAARAPAIFDTKDSSGKRAAERMGEKLGAGKAKDDFLGSLSRIEFREIRKEVALPKAKTPAPRQRL